MKGSVHLHAPTTVPYGKSPISCWIGDWMDPRAVLDTEEEKNNFFLQGIEYPIHFPACSPVIVLTGLSQLQSLNGYRLSYNRFLFLKLESQYCVA
jgi:hypothetical protein